MGVEGLLEEDGYTGSRRAQVRCQENHTEEGSTEKGSKREDEGEEEGAGVVEAQSR